MTIGRQDTCAGVLSSLLLLLLASCASFPGGFLGGARSGPQEEGRSDGTPGYEFAAVAKPFPASGDAGKNQPGNRIQPRGKEILHLVKEGDTIFAISKTYGVHPEKLREVNNLDERFTIYIGIFLLIPEARIEQSSLPESIQAVPVEPLEVTSLEEPTSSDSASPPENPESGNPDSDRQQPAARP